MSDIVTFENNIEKLGRFSPSMIITYLNCPLSFYYQYIAKIRLPQKQIHLIFGSAVHEAVEAIFNKKDPFPYFDKTFDKKKLLDEEKNLYDEFCKLGHEMIRNYIKVYPTLNNLYKLSEGESELWIKRKLINPMTGEESSLPISGKIDRLTNGGRIVEYKTSKNKWKAEDLSYKLQTLLYNLWYHTEKNVMPEETVYIVLLKKYKHQGRGETYQVLTKHCTLEELASAFEEVELILQKINNNEFERPKGWHPKWCDCYRFEEALTINNQQI